MPAQNPVIVADGLSRRRPYALLAGATYISFVLVRFLAFPSAAYGAYLGQGKPWAFSMALLLLALLPIAGVDRGNRIRALVNDELTRRNMRNATAAGFWLAMGVALGLFFLPLSAALTARDTIFLIVTTAAAGATYVLAALEWRANRDG